MVLHKVAKEAYIKIVENIGKRLKKKVNNPSKFNFYLC